MINNQKSRGHKKNWNKKACFVCRSLNHLIKDCDYYEKQMVQNPAWNNAMRMNHQNLVRMTHRHSNRNVVPTAVLTRLRLVSFNAAIPVPTAVPQSTVKTSRPVKHVVNKEHLPIRRPNNYIQATKNSNFNRKVTTVKVNKGNPQQALRDKGYVSFGGNTKGGKISGNGKIETDTECVVLSSDYQLPDENHVLPWVLRENNMYNVDLKNVVPSGDLTCLFTKATLDESNLWHKRLGHINFKNMNKLVKGNHVRGLPSMIFENNHTCVACQKGKQHKASWNGPKWLFDIDTLTKSMNYEPVSTGIQPNDNEGIKENLDAGKIRKETVSAQQYVMLLLWSTGLQDPQNTDNDAAFNVKENENDVHVSPSESDKTDNKKHDDKAKRDAKRKNMPELEDIVYSDDEEVVGAEADLSNLETNISANPIPTTRVYKDHPATQIIVDVTSAPQTRSMTRMAKEQEPKKVHQALKDPSWIKAMQEELLQFKMQKVWVLVDLPKGKRAIGSKWVFRNKKDERRIVIRNKARLVTQGHTQEEGINYDEVFAPVVRIEAIWLFLAYASFMGFMVYQMDIKSTFLYGTIKEKVYVCQPPGFEDPYYPDKVYKVAKALYGLHQALGAWYETLANYLLENGFQKGKIDQTLFIKKQKGDILLVRVYVDDIIFGSTNKELCKAFDKLMKDKFQMSSIGELSFFLGLQVKQKDDGIFISQDKYVAKILKNFGFTDVKSASTPIETEKPLLKNPDGEDVDTVVATSSTEAECVATVSCCAQVLCIQNQLLDYGVVRNMDCPSKFLMYPHFLKVVMDNQVNDLTSRNTRYTSPALTQKVFANMQRVGKGFSSVETPLFASMLVPPQPQAVEAEKEILPHATPHASPPQEQLSLPLDSTIPLLNTLMETYASLSQKVAELEHDKHTQALEILKLKKRVNKLEKKKRSKHSGLKRLRKGRIDQEEVNAVSKGVCTAEPTVFDDEEVTMTMAQTLIKLKAEKAKLLDEQMAQKLHDEEVKKAAARDKQEKDDLERS
uniref:Putative ribonuclease H-like domain-containing protein n=1 Tax=Tanacetum cinerariifolium TaxID=118510 RepID=A0A6L2NUP3_TANCI|nr:putative ribonuclease H-like domain-containing protein [Tanacetum cinerariifolium]